MKITFKEFHNFLCENGCSEAEIRHLFGAVRSMDPESRNWVIRWFCTGELPGQEVEGVTARELIDHYGYKPLNAFIVLDWLKADPQAAKYFLLKIPSTIPPDESIGEEMEKLLKQEGHEPSEPFADVDQSDIRES